MDIGWAGTGAISIKHLVETKWNIPCKIYGMLAGTNTVYNDEPNASEFYLADGILDSYLFSQSKNRDILKRHDPNRNMNVYWEILLSSEQKHFTGYDINGNDKYLKRINDKFNLKTEV